MKKQFQHLKLLLPVLLLVTALSSQAQQEFTLTTTPANIISSRALIDLPGLSGNTLAIIVATPLGNTKALNLHPTGAWYYSGKWNIHNTDNAVLIPGLTYKVQYFLSPGPDQFLHLVTEQNIGSEGSYIDNPALNNKPNVQFTIFQNHSPDVRPGSHINPFEAKAVYSAASGKWYITNAGGQPLLKGAAYNIVISTASSVGAVTNPAANSSVNPCNCPTSLPPNGIAGGDLTGTYPNPTIQKLLGRPLSNTAPIIGQMLKWNGTEWVPANESAGNGTTYIAAGGIQLTGTLFTALFGTPIWNASKLVDRDISTNPPAVGQVLKWGGGSWYPADDNVGSGGTNNPESWKTNGINISNTNTGNVGIGTTNPNAPLGFPSVLGKKIILYPGTTGDVGFGVAGNRLQIYADNPNADVAIGYDAAGTFNERFAVKANGAIAVSGDAGQNGQVLTSSGAGSPPSWKQPGGGAAPVAKPSVLFFNQSGTVKLYSTPTVYSVSISGLDNQSFTLAQSSRIVFHTVLVAQNTNINIGAGATSVMLNVEILNTSNTVVARTTSDAILSVLQDENISSAGIGILPAGTFHTRVSVFSKSRNGILEFYTDNFDWLPSQGGHLIIEIFPD